MIAIKNAVVPLFALVLAAAPAAALEEKRHGDIAYITGGVGENELAEIKDRSVQYTLGVMIARKGSGDFLADCRVTVTRGDTVLLEAVMDGPFLFARLPPGTYRLRAQFEGTVQERQVTIGTQGGISRVNLYWD